MRKYLVFLFIFVFSPLAFNVSGNVGSPEIDKPKELVKSEPIPKTVKDELIEAFSDWEVAEASYYDPMDSTQTKKNPDGKGTLGRLIKSGSVSIGASFSEVIYEKNMKVFLQIENMNIVTPYGKGIFRIDDIMASRFNKGNKIHIDFFHEDLNVKYKRLGRFKILFKIVKIEMADS
ncbi:TPA: hypothetical protein DCX66_02775 [Candidatus Nomurabacteria bacterium]|uniref:3D domain-containing protein n=1 Tax=Candidatus Nomurabacteria bacterium GW2011_GWE1_35_16 TaxID=1618761 RepID=A0A0G0B9Q3_9BACT|nr:MAG: hypothetical protein UR55_C0013G0015 [Candidatus Nomurabacteria bacterium GW2011_GWF1_34_20]KKP62746.1 MAG: hypothetical protein UR57_C0012G0015 [Candidatus Nomurabacteria bacterium GW2011_GWE2_34_25]KKP66118.1 MAG: hypothetical protein UR64_C0012G0015 [Candidatus Nomurabacteria bacterium GW2011_GWE1_35_16]HAE36342.1 hypothetical protein [Candidatus Nomurabacteria bacterium]HAX65372.1 hypothetical protein [Candidatus Nomurabacteria bacterium]